MTADLVCVGVILGAHGVKGQVRIKSFTTEPEAVMGYSPLFDKEGQCHFQLFNGRLAKGKIIAHLDGVTSRESAENLKGLKLFVKRSQLPQAGHEEYYHVDLLNMSVLDQAGQKIGCVKAVFNYGAHDILEITNEEKQEIMIPFTEQAVPEIDMNTKRLIVDSAFILRTKDRGRGETPEQNG